MRQRGHGRADDIMQRRSTFNMNASQDDVCRDSVRMSNDEMTVTARLSCMLRYSVCICASIGHEH
jgi:hypothetical protein